MLHFIELIYLMLNLALNKILSKFYEPLLLFPKLLTIIVRSILSLSSLTTKFSY